MIIQSPEARLALIDLQRAPRASDDSFAMGAQLFQVCVDLGWVGEPASETPMVGRVTSRLSRLTARAFLARDLGDWEFRVQRDVAAGGATQVA